MTGFESLVGAAARLETLLSDETALLSGPFDVAAHESLASEKAAAAEQFAEALQAVKRDGRSVLAAVPESERTTIAARLETLQAAMDVNARTLRHRAELSQGILNAVEGEARRAAGPVLTTYGGAPAPRRPSSLAVNAHI